MKIEINTKRVANLLKIMINQRCEEGFKWYTDTTDEMPSVFDINDAIKILENSQVKTITLINEGK